MKIKAPLILLLVTVLPAFVTTGCVSSRYKLAPKGNPPAVTLNLAAVQPPVEAVLQSVIVYRGPGSWKNEAYWDEYVVTLANRGTASMTIESAQLSGLAGTTATPGNQPWRLESQSRTLAEKGFGLGQDVVVQLGSGAGAISLAAGMGALAGGSGLSAVGGAALGAAVALPVIVGGSIYRNVSSRHEIEREFERRRLVLPVNLVPGQIVQGSLFLPITPSPQRLTLAGRAGADPCAAVINLQPLASLHLEARPGIAIPPPPAASPSP